MAAKTGTHFWLSRSRSVRALAVLGLACASVFVLWRSGLDFRTSTAMESGAKALRAAISMEAGPARDAQLDVAQSAFQQVLARHPDDGLTWSRLAEARLLQATGAALGRVSPALLEASIEAGSRAEALGRDSATDLARQAFALSLLPDQGRRAATALAASYAREPMGAGLAERRLPAAQRVWAQLDGVARIAAQKEACASLADPLALGRDGERVLYFVVGSAEAPNAFCRRAGFASAS